MTWDAIGAIANLVGAAGVIASLIFLGISIRQNTRMARARAFQEIFASFTAQNLDMFGPDHIDVVISGMRDFNSLYGSDKLRFDHLITSESGRRGLEMRPAFLLNQAMCGQEIDR